MFLSFFQLLAQQTTPVTQPFLSADVEGLSGWGYVNRVIANLVSIGFVVGIVIFLFILIWGGISWINAKGDRAALEAARHKVLNAITGLLLLLLLYVILTIILLMFGVNIGRFGLSYRPTNPPAPSPTSGPVCGNNLMEPPEEDCDSGGRPGVVMWQCSDLLGPGWEGDVICSTVDCTYDTSACIFTLGP
jgi:hypothetical protein